MNLYWTQRGIGSEDNVVWWRYDIITVLCVAYKRQRGRMASGVIDRHRPLHY